jgi:hypothetical protein
MIFAFQIAQRDCKFAAAAMILHGLSAAGLIENLTAVV